MGWNIKHVIQIPEIRRVSATPVGEKMSLFSRILPHEIQYSVKGKTEAVIPSKMKLFIRAFSQNAAPGLVTKELTHARSCVRRSTHSVAILTMLDCLVRLTWFITTSYFCILREKSFGTI